MKKSVHEIYVECKKQNLSDKEFVERLKEEGIIIKNKKKPKKRLTDFQKYEILEIITMIGKRENYHFFRWFNLSTKKEYSFAEISFSELNFSELVIKCEKMFKIILPDDKLNDVKTISNFFELIEYQL